MATHADRLRPTHLVSLVPADEQPPTPVGLGPGRHLRVPIDDISEPLPGYTVPDEDHVRVLIEFMRRWHDGGRPGGPILLHCLAGISRSMAAALIGLALRAEGREDEAARRLRQAAPHASPNRRMVVLADQLLGRDGRLIRAREAMGEPEITGAGPLVRLSLHPHPASGR
jgi:predicted protein tyrosine phosphatase